MKTKDPAFTSLQNSDEKLCGFLDWLLDAIEVHDGRSRSLLHHNSWSTQSKSSVV